MSRSLAPWNEAKTLNKAHRCTRGQSNLATCVHLYPRTGSTIIITRASKKANPNLSYFKASNICGCSVSDTPCHELGQEILSHWLI